MHICNREEIPIDQVFFVCFGLYAMIVSSYKILKIFISNVRISYFKVLSKFAVLYVLL